MSENAGKIAVSKHPNDAVLDEMHDLVMRKKVIEARLDALSKDLICETCGGGEDVGIRLLATDTPICKHCFHAWHDGARTAEAIRAQSLREQGRA